MPSEKAADTQAVDLLGFLSDFRAATSPPVREDKIMAEPQSVADRSVAEEFDYDLSLPSTAAFDGPVEQFEYNHLPPPAPPAPLGHYPLLPTAPGTFEPAWSEHFSAPPRTSPLPMIGAIVGAAALTIAGLVGYQRLNSHGPSLAGLAPAAILQKTVTAALNKGTVHLSSSISQGTDTLNGSTDMSQSGGVGTFSDKYGTSQILSSGGTLFVRADAKELESVFDFEHGLASQYAQRWMSLPTNNAALSQAAESLQTPILVNELLNLGGSITEATSPAPGEIALVGAVPNNEFNQGSGAGDSATLVISAKSPFLPISISFSDSQDGATVLTFSHWGEHVDVVPPTGATPFPLHLPSQQTTTS